MMCHVSQEKKAMSLESGRGGNRYIEYSLMIELCYFILRLGYVLQLGPESFPCLSPFENVTFTNALLLGSQELENVLMSQLEQMSAFTVTPRLTSRKSIVTCCS